MSLLNYVLIVFGISFTTGIFLFASIKELGLLSLAFLILTFYVILFLREKNND